MPTPDYKYGQVTGLFPDLRIVSERAEPSGNRMVCCGYCSAQMAMLTAKKGLSTLMANEAHSMRRQAGRAHNAGSNPAELRNGASKVSAVKLVSISKADIPDRLRKGYAVVLSISYAKLPSYLKVQTNDFGHSVTLFGWKEDGDHAGFFDPLWTQGARGAWAPWSHITPSLWPDGSHSTTVVKLVQAGEVMAQRGITTKTPKLIRILKDQDIYDLDGMTKLYDSAMERLDVRASPNGRGTHTDGRKTGGGVSGISTRMVRARRPPSACCPRSGLQHQGVPAPPPTGGATPEELLAAKQEGYDLAMSPFPPRPK